MENLQRPSETSKKDRVYRKTDPSQHKGKALCLHHWYQGTYDNNKANTKPYKAKLVYTTIVCHI